VIEVSLLASASPYISASSVRPLGEFARIASSTGFTDLQPELLEDLERQAPAGYSDLAFSISGLNFRWRSLPVHDCL
jgi:hypothetical protein